MNGVCDLIGANGAGIIAGRNSKELAHALVRLARDPELRAQAGRIATQRAGRFRAGSSRRPTPLAPSIPPRNAADPNLTAAWQLGLVEGFKN